MSEKKSTKIEPGPIENVVRDMGPWHGFNPLPGHGHKWMLASHIDLSPTCYVIWAWLFDHTLALGAAHPSERYGPRSPYAVIRRKDETIEAHLEHIAADTDVEIHNLRKYWLEGAAAGVWRNGTEEEGTRRMFLCTEVQKAPEKRVDTPDSGVCTYPWEKLPSYVSNHIQTLPPEQIKHFWEKYETSEEVGKLLSAEVIAIGREVMGQEQDNLFREFGADKIRQVHTKNGVDPEALKARAARLAKLREPIQGYVHTLQEYVQTTGKGSYKAARKPQNNGASLLGLETPTQKTDTSAGRQSLHGHQSRNKTFPDGVGSAANQLPVPPAVTPRKQQAEEPRIDPKLTGQEATAFGALFDWQEKYDQCDFGEEIDARNKGQITSVRALLKKLDGDMAFFEWAEGVKIPEYGERRALGKRAGPGGRFLGLLMDWADEYLNSAEKRALRQKEKAAAFQRAADNSKELGKALDQQAIKAALAELKDPKSTETEKQLARETLDRHDIKYGVEDGTAKVD